MNVKSRIRGELEKIHGASTAARLVLESGAVLSLLIWVLASFVVRGTVGAALGGTSIYGPLSAPIVVLIWLYALAAAVLIGAALNAATRVIWPVETHTGTTGRLVGWARSGVARRRSTLSPGPPGTVDDPVLGRRIAQEKQYIDPAADGSVGGSVGRSGARESGRREAS